MVGKRFVSRSLLVCVALSIAHAQPVAATPAPPDTIIISGMDTGVKSDCARVGTAPTPSPNARWNLVPTGYTIASEEVAGRTPIATCVASIHAALDHFARNETALNGNLPQLLRDRLFSGRANLARPYEVFLNNIYLTGPALASLEVTAPDATIGLGSCEVLLHRVIISCNDNDAGGVVMRDQWGNPILGFNGLPLELQLGGLLSQGGGTMYGSAFLQNAQGTSVPGTPSLLVQQHEQVHGQQWAQYGWDFGHRYVSESADDPGQAWWHWFTTGQSLSQWCFNAFERAANFQWGGYTNAPYNCPPSWT